MEVDESYCVGRRKGKRGRGTAGKIPVFGILKRGGLFATARSSPLRICVSLAVCSWTSSALHSPETNAYDVPR